MKHLIAHTLTSLSLAVLLLAGVAHAQYTQVIKVNVPFDFAVGHQTFPAGEYSLVRTAPYLLVLRDAQARVLANLITRSAQAASAPAFPRLEFYSEGGQYRLAQVWQQNDTIGHELYRPKAGTVVARHRTVRTQASAAASQP
jgi:hypothetical protein